MKIAYNASAVLANNSLFRNNLDLSVSLKRLSSGYKITDAKDNPSGLAMARRMNAQLVGISVANQNASDAISVIAIADGALSEVHAILQRINELAVKASNEILMDDDRQMIHEEVAALKKEVTRIARTTEFNGQKILDGSFDFKGYTYDAASPGPGMSGAVDLKVASYGDYVKNGFYSLDSLSVEFDDEGNIIESSISFISNANPSADPPLLAIPDNVSITADGKVVKFMDMSRGFELKLEVREPNPVPGVAKEFADILIEIVGFGSMDMQIGANEGQQLNIRIATLSLEIMGISNIDLSTHAAAEDALRKMGGAINYISSARSKMGAYQNRLEHTISNLDITTENLTAAYSRIMDVDMAEEMTKYTTLQILVQASTSMLAQANERPSNVLQLLQ